MMLLRNLRYGRGADRKYGLTRIIAQIKDLLHMFRLIRRYATESKKCIDHSLLGLTAWPKSKSPTAHEIFGFDPAGKDYRNRQEFERMLKAKYKKLVKLYHPDLSINHDVVENDQPLLAEKKRSRFDEVQKAYEILKDPSKRLATRKYETANWEDFRYDKANSFEAYRYANAHRKQYAYGNDPKFWHAATWEDYYRMKWGAKPPTMEEFEKNKWKILWRVLAVGSIALVLQVMFALDRVDEFNRQTRLMNLRANADISDAYNNYDEGHLRFQRIRRFLLYRRLFLENRDDEALKAEENTMLTRYAQLQVLKFGENAEH